MTAGAPPNLPLKWLLALTAGVLLVHVLLLQGRPLTMGVSQPPPVRAFTTRSVELIPTSTPAPPAVAPVRPKPAPVITKKPPRPAAPSPEQELTPPPNTSDITPRLDEPTPDTVAQEEEPPADLPPLVPRDQALVASSYSVPGSVRLKYKVDTNKFPYTASADLLWQQNNETYEARLELSVFGQARVQTSRGQVTSEGLAPIRFSDKFRAEVAAHFNRELGKVTFSANTPDVPLLAGAQDRLSILVQLASMLKSDPAHFPQASTLIIQTIGPRDADTWLFTVGDEETLALPGGTLSALKLVRNPRREFDQKVELWLAPALNYLPARVRITEPSGDFIDQQWLATEPLMPSQ